MTGVVGGWLVGSVAGLVARDVACALASSVASALADVDALQRYRGAAGAGRRCRLTKTAAVQT
jgi:hypothetical protein